MSSSTQAPDGTRTSSSAALSGSANSSVSGNSVVASLELHLPASLQQQITSAHVLIDERRYREAEIQIKAMMAETQQRIKSASGSSSSSSTPLPTVSQLMTAFLPLLRTISQRRKENEEGEFDFYAIQMEVENIKAEEKKKRDSAAAAGVNVNADANASADSNSNSNVASSRPRIAHAEYLHPQLRLAPLEGRGHGVVVAQPSLPDGCAAPAASHCSEDDKLADHLDESPAALTIPPNTTLFVSKAIGFVTAANSDAAAPSATDSAVSHEERMANALVTLLALKLSSDAALIPQLYQLDAGETYEVDRISRLSASDAFAAYRPKLVSSPLDSERRPTDSADLEIDLARLALIVARNAFAPPQPADSQSVNASPVQSTGLWLPCSFINHSCRPNAHWYVIGDYMIVRSLREIAIDEEVTISYTGFDAKKYSQRQEKCQGWGFECRCSEWCDAYLEHPALITIENEFVDQAAALEPRVHALVDTIHTSDEGTAAYRNSISELKSLKSKLEMLIDQFRSRVREQCNDECKSKSEDQTAAASAGVNSATTDAKKSSGSASSSTPSAAFASHPAHTRGLLLHLALPLTLLALCHISVQSNQATAKTYMQSLKKHEELSLQSIELLSGQYGSGDETCIFAWFELLNTWMQFAMAGVEYRTVEQMKAIMKDMCIARHMDQFGVKQVHFVATWNELLKRMGLDELVD